MSREYGPAAQVAWAWPPGRRADVRCTGRAKYSAWRAPGRAGLRGANLGALQDASFSSTHNVMLHPVVTLCFKSHTCRTTRGFFLTGVEWFSVWGACRHAA